MSEGEELTEELDGDDKDEAGFLDDLDTYSKSPDSDEVESEPAESSGPDYASMTDEEFDAASSDPSRFGPIEDEERSEAELEGAIEIPSWALESDEAWNARVAGFHRGDTLGIIES